LSWLHHNKARRLQKQMAAALQPALASAAARS
jgi:hypothetical protein